MILIFDLDDTLYDERTFAISGFRAVARFLKQRHNLPEKECFEEMRKIESERSHIFDRVLQGYGIYSRVLLRNCVKVYRSHRPSISLFPDAARCLKRFQQFPLYVVTDGHKQVQLNKLKMLGLWEDNIVRRSLRTNAYGQKYAKPNSFCFDLIARREKEPPENIIYVADNPSKDFLIKRNGYKTVRLMRGHYKDLNLGPEYEAHIRINNLDELTFDIIQMLGLI